MKIEIQYSYENKWSEAKEAELLKVIAEEVGDADPKGTLDYIKEVIKTGKTITVGSCKFRMKQ